MVDSSQHRKDGAKVWQRHVPLGQLEVVRGLGGIVAPLLAGFSLAAIATLVTSDSPPRLADASLASFALAAALLLFAMQLAFWALRYGASPEERLSVNPRATKDLGALESERELQHYDFAAAELYAKRTGILYDLGLLSFLVGLTLLLIPDHWTLARVIAVVATGIAVLGEGFMTMDRWWRNSWLSPLYKFLLPLRQDIENRKNPEPLDEVAIKGVLGDDWKEGS